MSPVPSPPLLSAELIAFIESGLSVLVGTRDANLMPETVRGVGVVPRADGRSVRIYIPAANGARTLDNLRDNGHVALTMSRPSTHETVQLKGTVTSVTDAGDHDRALVDRYLATFAEVLSYCGMAQNLTRRLCNWPAAVIDMHVTDVFQQTPGPGAGERLAGP